MKNDGISMLFIKEIIRIWDVHFDVHGAQPEKTSQGFMEFNIFKLSNI